MPKIDWFTSTSTTEVALLLLAFVLSAIVGAERETKLKSAGLRTHTLVGVGSALFTIVSAYGFSAQQNPDVVLDPSRIAAQVVSGIGFIGAGVIFVKKDAVSGLTTAASIWLVAAIGMACAAGAPLVAIVATALHLITVTILGKVRFLVRAELASPVIEVTYRPKSITLGEIVEKVASTGVDVQVHGVKALAQDDEKHLVQADLHLLNNDARSSNELLALLMDVAGIEMVRESEAVVNS